MRILRLARLAAGALFCVSTAAAPAVAQQRRYLVELGAGGLYTSFDDLTSLQASAGGFARAAVWLPYRVSLEGEFGFASPKSTAGPAWSATTMSVALLGNLAVGNASSAFVKVGYGSTRYDDSTFCPGSTVFGPCGSAAGLVGGIGFRAALTPTVMLRADGSGSLARVSVAGVKRSITNIGVAAGVSVMLASRPLTDLDRDGVFDSDDDCPTTPLGALTDRRGCPTDADRDRVADGLDRCPSTPVGAEVNAAGCPRDEDGDSVADGIDKCPATPAGAAADATGCPQDEDDDKVFDGLDRCPATPKGASVDQLGCPGDEDGDRVLDGLDRCPRTPAGTAVNAFGCAPGMPERATGGTLLPGSRRLLTGVAFAARSAQLPAAARPQLDSVATTLRAQPAVYVEIAAHGDGTASETQHLTQLRADAVRRYLISKGVSLQRITARGYGAAERVSQDTTAAARTANRRVEMRVLVSPTAR